MTKASSSQSFPNDYWPQNDQEKKNHDALPKPPMSGSLFPIDETDDFHDPYSDLNLFLSTKIKSQIEKHGSSNKWSSKIEGDLLKNILPEFKLKFPKYRLGISALKKVWEKVSYYYGKVSLQKEAIGKDGKLNIHYMIKENLKSSASLPDSSNLPPYNSAHQLAVKMSECIATLDGEKPQVEKLTKTIWAAQKHLIKNLPSQKSKNPFEEYGNIDKLVVKSLLEKTSNHQLSSYQEIVEEVKGSISKLHEFVTTHSKKSIYQKTARLLANKVFQNTQLISEHSEKKLENIYTFILHQIQLNQYHNDVEDDSSFIETTQRIVALYPLAAQIPKSYEIESVKKVLYLLYHHPHDHKPEDLMEVHPSISMLISAELHFLKRKESAESFEDAESHILSLLEVIQDLPSWQDYFQEELEIFVWMAYNKLIPSKDENLSIIEDELEQAYLNASNYRFQNIIYMVTHFFQKAKEMLSRQEKEDEDKLWECISHKIELWTLQNDMICRWIHFDKKDPLLEIIDYLWKEEKKSESTVDHDEFISKVVKTYIDTFESHIDSEKKLISQAKILYKYYWYHSLSSPEETTLSRFIKWHSRSVSTEHKTLKKEQKVDILNRRLQKLLPLIPVKVKDIEQSFN